MYIICMCISFECMCIICMRIISIQSIILSIKGSKNVSTKTSRDVGMVSRYYQVTALKNYPVEKYRSKEGYAMHDILTTQVNQEKDKMWKMSWTFSMSWCAFA